MAGTPATQQAVAVDAKLVAPLEPSVTSTAESMLTEAIKFCARKIGVDSVDTVADLLRQNDRTACEYCLYGIAKQAAISLGAMDENVKAVYVVDYDATPEDICLGALSQGRRLVHLIVWTGCKTAALSALVAALDRAVAQAYTNLLDGPEVKGLLDVQLVDDADVEGRTGHGALLWAIHHQPIPIWER